MSAELPRIWIREMWRVTNAGAEHAVVYTILDRTRGPWWGKADSGEWTQNLTPRQIAVDFDFPEAEITAAISSLLARGIICRHPEDGHRYKVNLHDWPKLPTAPTAMEFIV